MAVPRGWCLHGYRCGVEKKGTGGRWRQEGDAGMRGWEREQGTYVHLSTGVVDVLRIICVLCSLLHCALFSAPTAYYLLALTCNCIDLQYTTRTRPHPRPDGFFSSFRECIRTLPGDGSLLRLARRVMEQPLMLHFVVPACHVILFCLLECRDWIFLRALCFCTLRRYCTVKIWRYLFFCGAGAFLPPRERIPNMYIVGASSPAVTVRQELWFMDISS